MYFSGNIKFRDWAVQARTVYDPQLCFGPYTTLSWTVQSVNMHVALKAMFYLLNQTDIYLPDTRHSRIPCHYSS